MNGPWDPEDRQAGQAAARDVPFAAADGAAADPYAVDAGLLSPVRAGAPVERAVSDLAWLRAMLDAEAALARAQAAIGAVPPGAARAITDAARADRLDLRALAVHARESGNPVVGLVRALTGAVAVVDPEAAEYVHRGSTSQDVFDTAAMLVAKGALGLLRADLARVGRALAGLARTHRDTVVAGRTLGRHAVPTTFGLKAAGWRELVLAADARVAAVRDALPVSLGGAAGTLAGYGADAERLVTAFAAETGLRAPVLPWHTLRTPIADLGAALAHTAGALGKLAVDVQSLSRTEVGEVGEPHVPGRGGSSAMPQKRNPVLTTLIRSAALQVPPLAGILTQCLLSEDERSAGAWHAEWQPLRECLRLTGGAAHTAVELTEGLVVHPDRMRTNLALTGGQLVAERLVAELTPLLGRAAARDLVTTAAAAATRDGRPLATHLKEAPALTGRVTRAELDRWCDPAGYVGAAGALVEGALTRGEER
ncbi:3-carboxy-cis,cis-muconate cycloisomerase [Streptomyces sp. YIM 121038]|uniref:3-carboxy-cis,cis-muconate cycloisomerase n=1 Tax=Streptomyces sp. YIM 121038 TaxID=2136401 RepID=UPI001110064B|nr:3-carboxy-cis,cis-muconate cycloisomerase [Streptomyces sp. YIM 121038]QCX79129.1 3-carboxy-cis,cis-muconate cycloisomerase [Streptomyces sp. YIM 121038]